MEWESPYRVGDMVIILGQKVKLRSKLECEGGWWVEPPVKLQANAWRFWNEQEMKTLAMKRLELFRE